MMANKSQRRVVRKSALRDRVALSELWVRCFADKGHTLQSFEVLFFDLENVTLVVDEEGLPVGCLIYRQEKYIIEVLALMVREGFRGAGIGTSLMDACIAHGRSLGVREFRLQTQGANKPAQRLFDGLGFDSTLTSQTYLSGETIVDYRLEIKGA